VPARRVSQSKEATRLAQLRVERGLTQNELAEATGLSIATLRRLERGTIDNPPLRYLANCAIVLGCQLEDLIEDEWRAWLALAKPKPPRKPEALWKPGRFTGEG
jgi:transcriptional regulator with XRE-family HTH domain